MSKNKKENLKAILKKIREIRKDIKNECISYGGIAILQEYAEYVKEYFPDDILLWQWAGLYEEE